MADDLDLAIRIRADVKSAIDGLSKAEAELKDVGGAAGKAEAELKDVGQAAGRTAKGFRGFGTSVSQLVRGDLIARGLTSIARAARQMVVETVRAGVEAQSFADSMRAATGDGASAARELAFVGREAARLGLDLPGAERAFIKLVAATRGTRLEGAVTREIFLGIGEAARAMGLSAEQQSGALTALEQIVSKSTVSAEELRGQLGERLPGAFQIAARAMGVSTEELDRMLRGGERKRFAITPLSFQAAGPSRRPGFAGRRSAEDPSTGRFGTTGARSGGPCRDPGACR